jgi:hypothetical protein
MAEFTKSWSMFGDAFCLAICETGRAIAEGTHDAFQYVADATKPETPEETATRLAQEALKAVVVTKK